MNATFEPLNWRYQTTKNGEYWVKRTYVCDYAGAWKDIYTKENGTSVIEYHFMNTKYYSEDALLRAMRGYNDGTETES